MDTSTLVTLPTEDERQIGVSAADAIRKNDKLAARAVMWWFDDEIQQWKLLVSTPVVDNQGPRTAYTLIRKTLEHAKLSDQIPIDRVRAVEVDDPIVSAIAKIAKAPHTAFINCVINHVYIAGVYVIWMGKKRAKPRKRRRRKTEK